MSPRLSLFSTSSSRPVQGSGQSPRTPCRAFPSPQMPSPTSFTMLKQQPQNHWDNNYHNQIRQFHEKTTSEINLGAKQKKQGQKMVPPPQDVEGHDELLYDDDDSEDVVEDGVLPIGKRKNFKLKSISRIFFF